MKSAALVIPGMIFGSGLAISGMTDPRKVIGFLDLAGDWDPSLALVMAGALVAFAVLTRIAGRSPRAWLGGSMPGPPSSGLDRRLVGGAALFGVGWGLGGFCPGPALTSLAAAHVESAVFVAGMVVGMIAAQGGLGADRAD